MDPIDPYIDSNSSRFSPNQPFGGDAVSQLCESIESIGSRAPDATLRSVVGYYAQFAAVTTFFVQGIFLASIHGSWCCAIDRKRQSIESSDFGPPIRDWSTESALMRWDFIGLIGGPHRSTPTPAASSIKLALTSLHLLHKQEPNSNEDAPPHAPPALAGVLLSPRVHARRRCRRPVSPAAVPSSPIQHQQQQQQQDYRGGGGGPPPLPALHTGDGAREGIRCMRDRLGCRFLRRPCTSTYTPTRVRNMVGAQGGAGVELARPGSGVAGVHQPKQLAQPGRGAWCGNLHAA